MLAMTAVKGEMGERLCNSGMLTKFSLIHKASIGVQFHEMALQVLTFTQGPPHGTF